MRVSIVINNFNYRSFVGQAIKSALAQTHRDTEVIVVDDGSTDDSLVEIGRFAGRVKLVWKPNGGQGSAYNTGYRHCSGDVVLFLDADDWLYPHAAQQIVDAWADGVSKLQFPLVIVDRVGNPTGRQVPRHLHDANALALVLAFGAYGSPPGSGNAFSRTFLDQVMPLDEATWRTAADSVPILLAPAFGRVVSLPDALGAYRQHRRSDDGSLVSNNAPTGLWHEYERICWTKRYLEQQLVRLGREPRIPQLMAPWEARLAALCVRFGGPTVAGSRRPTSLQLIGLALRSVWQWPMHSARLKCLLSIWMACVWMLPRPWALRAARLHRTSIGAVKAV